MILILVSLIVMIGLLSVVAQGVVGLYASISWADKLKHEQWLERMVVDATSRSLVPFGSSGRFIAPVGTPIVDDLGVVVGHGLPLSLQIPTMNAYGNAYRYCSLGYEGDIPAVGDTLIDVSLTTEFSYSAHTVLVDGVSYVYGVDATPWVARNTPNIVAFVISPREYQAGLSCHDIAYDPETGKYLTPGMNASVIPVLAPHVMAN